MPCPPLIGLPVADCCEPPGTPYSADKINAACIWFHTAGANGGKPPKSYFDLQYSRAVALLRLNRPSEYYPAPGILHFNQIDLINGTQGADAHPFSLFPGSAFVSFARPNLLARPCSYTWLLYVRGSNPLNDRWYFLVQRFRLTGMGPTCLVHQSGAHTSAGVIIPPFAQTEQQLRVSVPIFTNQSNIDSVEHRAGAFDLEPPPFTDDIYNATTGPTGAMASVTAFFSPTYDFLQPSDCNPAP